MSEHDTDPNQAVPGGPPKPGPPKPGPPVGSGSTSSGSTSSDADRATREAQEAEDSEGGPIPGEDPEDNPDLEGEERFDAG